MRSLYFYIKLLSCTIILSLFFFILAIFNRNSLPIDNLLPELNQNPIQTPTDQQPFSISYQDKKIEVQPLAHYEMWALVTSLSDSSLILTDHESNDINVRDVCTMWGIDLNPNLLAHFSSYNGEFTCYTNIESPEKYAKYFHIEGFVNNHLITDNEKFRKIIRDMRVGDQIYIKGLLVSYRLPEWSDDVWRKSSLRNNAVGNGACKVIYVQNVKILVSTNAGWNALYHCSKWLLIISVFLWLLVKALIIRAEPPRY